MIPLRDTLRSAKTPYVVYGLIAVNVLVFLYLHSLPVKQASHFVNEYGLISLRYSNPKAAADLGLSAPTYLPYISNLFIHVHLHHIAFNMWMLFVFGRSLEGRMGSPAFLLFYVLCGVGANIVHTSFNPYLPAAAIGASGAFAGVLGGYAVAFPHAQLIFLLPPFLFRLPALAFAVFWFGLQLISGAIGIFGSSFGSELAWWAHGGGFMMGMALAPLFPAHKFVQHADPRPKQTGPSASPPADNNQPEHVAEL